MPVTEAVSGLPLGRAFCQEMPSKPPGGVTECARARGRWEGSCLRTSGDFPG